MREYILQCVVCAAVRGVIASPADVRRWQHGKPIQDALPYLSVDDREMLITRLCPDCWDRIVKEAENQVFPAERPYEL